MTTFLIEKEPGFGPNPAVPGLTVPGKIEKMGYKGVDTTELILDGVRVPATRVLGERAGQGFYQMMDGVEVGRVNVAARGCGLALRAFELAIDYAQRRQAFGKPIAGHQAIQFKLADMATEIEAARWLTYRAAALRDAGEPFKKEAAMAKLKASRVATSVVSEAVQIFGGAGYMLDSDVARFYCDAKVLEIGEGTNEIQHLVIARELGCQRRGVTRGSGHHQALPGGLA
jgi:alkylation response protein AidB-like acyl-CoA dehydrogenase